MQKDRKNRVLFDRLSAIAIIMFLAPILCARALQAKIRTGRVFDKQSQVDGKHALLRFSGIPRGRNLARVLNVAAGTIAWVGPPILPAHRRRRAGDLPLSDLRPGLISIWQLQKLTGSAYDERPTHKSYPNHTLVESITIVARYLVARLMSVNPSVPKPKSFTLLNVKIANLTIEESLNIINDAVVNRTPTQFAFVNPDCLNKAYKDSNYKATLNSLPTVFADGIGIRVACKIMDIGLRDNINGTDLFPLICEQASNASGADILLVGLGAPRQDRWLAKQFAWALVVCSTSIRIESLALQDGYVILGWNGHGGFCKNLDECGRDIW